MLSADKVKIEEGQHPLEYYLPEAMPLPTEQTPSNPWVNYSRKGYYDFYNETTATTAMKEKGDHERDVHVGRYYNGLYIAVRGLRRLGRSAQTGWAGTLLEWTERNMTLIEQGQLPATAAGWKKLEYLKLRGEHLKNGNYNAALEAMTYLDSLNSLSLEIDEFSQDIPERLYKLSQVKNLRICNHYTGVFIDKIKWSISHVSSKIKEMKSLEDISFNWQADLTRVPDEIFDLPNLTRLYFQGCDKLIFTGHQINRICELVEAGVTILFLGSLNFNNKDFREMLSLAVKENGGEIDCAGMNKLFKKYCDNKE
jgi:hypothetical protein